LYYVYVLRSEKMGRFYTGSCADLEDRLRRHNAGQSLATRHGVPWRLVYQEGFASRAEAMRRERELKTGRGRDELRRMLG
jgi:putative endonuclease